MRNENEILTDAICKYASYGKILPRFLIAGLEIHTREKNALNHGYKVSGIKQLFRVYGKVVSAVENEVTGLLNSGHLSKNPALVTVTLEEDNIHIRAIAKEWPKSKHTTAVAIDYFLHLL